MTVYVFIHNPDQLQFILVVSVFIHDPDKVQFILIVYLFIRPQLMFLFMNLTNYNLFSYFMHLLLMSALQK